ncbi:hypothetical protein [Ulvibacterium marinum]|uniref:hypothetical protein n=1 Tax=Ulvibacterium marinum TaxID=2419782 RepID=UPI002494155D|nr:hypothetical protein [Ulvibacterium marinum]
MEPNNFEEHIKKQLEQRELQPSSQAWQKVADRLEGVPKRRSNRFLWYGVAASFMGLLIVSLVYLGSQRPMVNPDIEIVNTDSENDKVEDTLKKATDEKTFGEGNRVVDTNEDLVVEKSLEESVNFPNEQKTIKKKTLEDVKTSMVSTNTQGDKEVESEILSKDSEDIINTKIAEVVARVDVLEQKNRTVSDSELDSLLQKAQREIIAEKLFRDNGRVDAMALLTQVEDELDQSFRDQIFEKLKTGFMKVRTAVADRNN